MKPSHELDEGIIPGSRHLYVSHEMIGLPELQHIVASGVALWQRRMQQGDQVGREQAARAIKELSQILDSLSQQLAQGRRTMRITTRLPRTRTYTVGCPACGHGNRQEARFCQSCGTMLSSQAARIQPAGDPKLYLQTASQTDTGRQRPINEDTCAITTLQVTPQGRIMLLLVADGMGGAQAGEQASHLASEMVQQYLVQRVTQTPLSQGGSGAGGAGLPDTTWPTRLTQALHHANERVYQQGQHNQQQQGMGTTMTCVVVTNTHAHIAHVGDSRAYLINQHGVTEDGSVVMQLTVDHTLVARLVDIGQVRPEEARTHPQRNIIYRALGVDATLEVDTATQPITRGDILVLCSDGLTTYVDADELARVTLSASHPTVACQQLVHLANNRGGQDNISVIVARVDVL